MNNENWIPARRFIPEKKAAGLEGSADRIDEKSNNPYQQSTLVLPALGTSEEDFSQGDEGSVEGQQAETTCDAGAAVKSPQLRHLAKRNRIAWRWLLASGGILIACLFSFEIVLFLKAQYLRHVILGVFFTGLIASIIVTILVLAWREFRDIKRLRDLCDLQQQGKRFLHANSQGYARNYCAQVAALYQGRPDAQPRIENFESYFQDSHNDGELVDLFSKEVLRPLDQKAYGLVVNHARDTAILTALSFFAMLDVALVLWRNIRMIREIAAMYGGRPGFSASLILTRDVIRSLAFAGASDALADAAAETFGGSITSIFSAKLAEGIGNGIMTSRIGLRAIRHCRPIPFYEDEKPSFKHVRREILEALRKALSTPEAG